MRPTASATADRILMATAAGLVASLAVVQAVPPILSELGQASNWLWLVYTIVLLGIPFALLIPVKLHRGFFRRRYRAGTGKSTTT